MAEIDVPDYYGLAADNYDYVLQMVTDLQTALQQIHDSRETPSSSLASLIQNGNEKLQDPSTHDALATVAAIYGMDTNDFFSPAVMQLHTRHGVLNRLLSLFSGAYHLPKNSPLIDRMHQLFTKVEEKTKPKESSTS